MLQLIEFLRLQSLLAQGNLAVRSLLSLVFGLLFLGSGTAHGQVPRGIPAKLYPVDESHLEPSFAEFKDQLMEAIKRRDREFLRGALADEVSLSPTGFSTRERALAAFDNEDAEVDLWRELRDVLLLGATRLTINYPGVPKRDRFCAPSVTTLMPNRIEMIDMLVITGEEVSIHSEPKSSAPVIDSLSYDVVTIGPRGRSILPEEINGETYPWNQIVTPLGQVGYVYGKYARRWLDHEACFSKINGKWTLYSLSYGDP